MIYKDFVDRRNPQDYVRDVKDDQSLPFARPEPPNEYVATALLWEDDSIMTLEGLSGSVILSEGIVPSETL